MGSDKRNTILIVSGDKVKTQKLTDILGKNFSAVAVFQSQDWAEAKYKLANVNPKVVFVDEYIPSGSGIEIVTKILKDRGNKDVSIVIMSAVADHDKFANEVFQGRISFLTESDREVAVVQSLSKIMTPIRKVPDANFEIKILSPGEKLFLEGDLTEFVYIVKRGEMKAFAKDIDGGKIDLGEIKAGEFVGEMGHFNHEPRSATVEAMTEVELIAIPHVSLENVIFARPSWAKALVKTLSQRLRRANKALAG